MFRKLLKSSSLYIGASVITAGLGFLTLPIFTRVLSQADFGLLGVVTATLGVISPLVTLGAQQYLTSKYASKTAAELAEAISSILTLSVSLALLTLPALWLVRELWADFAVPTWTLLAIAGLSLGNSISQVVLTIFKMEEEVTTYALTTIGRSLLTHGAALFLVVELGWDWRGKFAGQVLAAIVFVCVTTTLVARRRQLVKWPRKETFKEVLSFSLPLLPHTYGFWAINVADRFFVAAMAGLKAAGLYTVAYSLGGALNFVHGGILKAFSPYFYSNVENEDAKVNVVRLTYAYFGLAFVGFVLFVAVMLWSLPWIVGDRFIEAAPFIPWIALGYTFNAVRNFMTGYLYVADKTGVLGSISMVSAVLNAALNYVLITCFGAIGAAYATAITFAFVAVVTTFVAVRSFDMPWLESLRYRASRDPK